MPTETHVHFNKQYLEEQIRQLAKLQRCTLESSPLQPIETVLDDARETLTETYRVLARAAKKNRELSSAGEWLIDNFYIIQEQIVQLTEDLPESYYRKLPRLVQGEYKGYPRTYEIVQMLAAISDNIIDQENTTIAIRAYQEVDVLNLAEMWSVPLMHRLALLLRLSDRSKKLLRDRQIQNEIDRLLSQELNIETDEPGYLLRKLSEIVEEKQDSKRFLAILAQRLQSLGILTESERRWFDYKFSRWETNLEEQLRNRTQQTSRLHLSIQNAISSLRVVSETDWSKFVESCSIVERILRLDPAGMYSQMDFNTRDTYRKKVEKLTAHSEYSEQQVAEQALLMAEQNAQNGTASNVKKMHIGYYLMGDGYDELVAKLGYRKPFDEWLKGKSEKHHSIYFSIIFVHVAVLLTIVGLFTNFISHQWFLVGITLLLALLPALELSIVSTNRILSFLLSPRIMPKLEFEQEIPHEYRTVVVVPTMFSSPEDVQDQFELLEIRALANANESLQFALLSDFLDASTETTKKDDAIMEEARHQLRRLNMRYHSIYGDKFLLFHRKRCWNESEQKWMGWERKRGKLEEFNKLAKHPESETTFTEYSREFLDTLNIHPVKYIITLDADTKLPPGSANQLIGTAAHPLNHPELDENRQYVKKGYGIFQPRISIAPKSANKSWFTLIFSGNVGLDPYTTAVSDTYQDLFGEGVFTGKGLYDLDVFEEVLGDRFPENAILSHDLLESTYLRTALLTDIELFDEYPSTYPSFARRHHRWIRGDWQILYWLFRKVPGQSGKDPNPTNGVSRWKIFDNLRRSLNPSALLIFLLAGWTILPGSPLIWTAAVFGIVAFPIYSSFSTDIFRRPERVGWKLYLEKIRNDLWMNTIQAVTSFLFLPHEAYISLDAIIRTLYRMFISRKKLLEWTTATQTDREHAGGQLWEYFRKMWFNVFWGLLTIALVILTDPEVLFIALPVGIGWILGPPVAYYLARTPVGKERGLRARELSDLRGYARRTWHYFEQFVTEEHSWLPPDNVQEDPYVGPVGRTSPTNMGLMLASVFAAYEQGYLTVSELVDRLDKTLTSMLSLDRYKGHFYNWYSTKLGEVLSPGYVSTVDSGNLAASLIVTQQGLDRIANLTWPNPAFWQGLEDTVTVVGELIQDLKNEEASRGLAEEISKEYAYLKKDLPNKTPDDIEEWKSTIMRLLPHAENLKNVNLSLLQEEYEDLIYKELASWFSRPYQQIEQQLEEINQYFSTAKVESIQMGNPGIKVKYLPMFSGAIKRAAGLAELCEQFVQEMDFSLLYNKDRKLFSIGYNVDRATMDKSFYDLFASEARLASFIAIAKGEVPPEHWFRLSRRLTSIEKNEILLSWSGTMFEYLMPLLFMSRYEKTLLSNTYDNVVRWQKDYGSLRNRPWGFSESGYNVVNLELHYQYRAFGVPGLALRRGLAEDYVVAPYAGMLALMVHPVEALKNLRKLEEVGAYGANGFYEAIDYTSDRINDEEQSEMDIVKMYMAHHQGMSLLALVNVLGDNAIQKLFHSHPLVRSCELLLQEKIPRGIPIKEPRPIDVELEPPEKEKQEVSVDHAGIEELNDIPPRVHILSNGRYSTLLTHTGTGYSSFGDTMLNRWRPDGVIDNHGLYFYIRDLESDNYWSVGHQPVQRKADRYDSWYHAGKMQIARVDDWIESFMEVCVSPEDDIELRKITLTNYSDRPRKIEITSYTEAVLNTQQADEAHPAFSNLFVQTEYIPEHHALLAKRRPRGKDDKPIWLVHTIASEDFINNGKALQVETERSRFIGRNRSLQNPRVLDAGAALSGTVGNVRDPIISMRREITLEPGEKRNVTFGLGIVENREEAVAMADRYDNPYATDRVFELASIYGNVELEHIGLSGEQAHYFQRLAGFLVYNSEELRTDENTLKKNRKKQSGLWSLSISGDVPILVYHIGDTKHIQQVELLLKAHALWRQKGLEIDLVFINEHPPSYMDELQEAINQKIQLSSERQKVRQRGGIFVLRDDELSPEDKILLDTVATAVIRGKLPNLRDLQQYTANEQDDEKSRLSKPVDITHHQSRDKSEEANLRFYNGYGGFTSDGREYVMHLYKDPEGKSLRFPPAPWINVLANPEFGCLASEKGAGYTWSKNSRENKLTPWSNDSVLDPAGEALYLRDDEQDVFWSPLPEPVVGSSFYEVRHGFGYSRYRSQTLNIDQEVTVWVSKEDPIKLVRLQLTNTDLMEKRLSVFRYLDWVMGVFREQSSRHVLTSFDADLQTIFARNYYNNEFAGRVAFAGLYTSHPVEEESYTSDRAHFIGKNCSLKHPRSVSHDQPLNGRFGTRFDACAASQFRIQLTSGESAEIYFMLGEAANEEEARKLAATYRDQSFLKQSLEDVRTSWDQRLKRIQIDTPLTEFDYLANGWLQYQNIGCRMWARTGFYQAGGAFGFRDQLQDAMAAGYLDPSLSRKQILLHAAHQFVEGDVLHWWHPPTDRGIRSVITDDLLWLPYATAFYIQTSGDKAILDEQIPFLTARPLQEEEHEAYLHPEQAEESASLYEHCCRAIDRSLTSGSHGLPLMGGGDWNDGMNNVGIEGKGESVWLGFFIYDILGSFIPITKKRGDEERQDRYRSYRTLLKKHLNNEGWDGEWFRRAFYDDGTPLGSRENKECKIDAIAQSWAVISGAGDKDKARKALESAEQYLVSESEGLIRLLTPPFDQTERNPGYIKGYIPGVRENGGQYTHAALWLVKAFAEIGDRARAVKLMQMLTPVQHANSEQKADTYLVEPYAVAADIYGEAPLTGMGGWTWYTGSSGWMYRVIIESILGISIVNGQTLRIWPLIIPDWKHYSAIIRSQDLKTEYSIQVYNPDKITSDEGKYVAELDGKPLSAKKKGISINMKKDGQRHQLIITLEKK